MSEMSESKYREMEKDIVSYRLAGDALGIAYWTANAENTKLAPDEAVEWSQAFRQMLGYADESDFPNVLGSWAARLHPDDQEATFKALWNHLYDTTGQTPLSIENRLMTKSGEYRHYHAVATTQRDAEGRPLRIAGAAKDITLEKQMQEEIERRDTLLLASNEAATLLLTSGDNSFVEALHRSMGVIAEAVGVDRVYVWKNHMADGQLGCGQIHEWSEVVEAQQGKEFAESIPYSDIPRWEEMLSSGQCINDIVRNMPPGEQAYLVPQGVLSILAVPVFLQDQFWGFVGFDDCQRERVFTPTEESILSSTSLLLANAWTREAAHQELEHERVKAESANQAKSDFLARMSHELRTPLNAVTGMAQVGLAARTLERKHYALGHIDTAGKHLSCVINNILDMSEIDAGRMELKPECFELEETLEEVRVIMKQLTANKQQTLEISKSDELFPALIGDAGRVRQVLVNLLGNAIKFTEPGGSIQLHVDLEKRDAGNCHVKISVKDTGIGLTPEQQEALFDPFAKFSAGTAKEQGSGLGLPITKHFVEMMGGTLGVKSEIGKGTEFFFTIPFEEAMSRTCELDVQEVEGANERNYDGHTVMVVDDVTTNLVVAEAILEETGIEVHGVSSAKQAIKLFLRNPTKYDMIFMDIMMPEMDGLECARTIREMSVPWAKEIPIVALSANAFNEDKDRSREAGMNDHFAKPFQREEILGMLDKHITPRTSLRNQKALAEKVGSGGAGGFDEIKPLVAIG